MNIQASVENYKTGNIYKLIRFDSSVITDDDFIQEIVRICNQPAVHKLFEGRIGNNPYSNEDAEGFDKWAIEGWSKNEWFVFLLLNNDNKPVGALDIKSNNKKTAEIGYWLNPEHSGVMTNAVKELEKYAKSNDFKNIYGEVEPDNKSSIKLLSRLGFKESGETSDGYLVYKKDLESQV